MEYIYIFLFSIVELFNLFMKYMIYKYIYIFDIMIRKFDILRLFHDYFF